MLQIIRDRAQGVFAWIIVGMISIPFALWGINSYFGGGGDDGIAEVDGTKITQRQVQNGYQQQRSRLQKMFGGKIPENLFSEEVMKTQVLDQLIEKEILINAALDNGMRVGDRQLAGIITGIDAFHSDGKFNAEQYERTLAQQGMSPRLFEQRVRRDLIAEQMTSALAESEFTLESEVNAQLRLQQQQRNIGYMIVPVSKYQESVELSSDEVREYYDTNSARYMLPEQVKIDYLELKLDDIATTIVVGEEELRQRYESQKLNFRTAEERKASHILIQVASSASESEINEARAKSELLLQRINGGENFAELAKLESQDPGSAKKGGDLGFFGQGVMDKAFEETTFSLQKGDVSGVIQSAFGFHIIKLEDIKGGDTKPYEDVAAELKREMQNDLAAEIFFDKAEQLASLTYEQPDTLSIAAEQLQLTIKSSDYFSRSGGAGIATDPKISTAAFDEDVMIRGNNSETIELADTHLVVLRINEHKPEALRPFEETKFEIENSLKQDKAAAKTLEEAKILFAKLQAGEDPESLASARELEWLQQGELLRDNAELDRNIVQATFRMPHPVEGGFSSEQLTLAAGDQALVILYGIKPGDVAAVEEATRSSVAQRIESANSNAAEQALIEGLRGRAEITTKP